MRTGPAVSKMLDQLAGDWIDALQNPAGYTSRYHLQVIDRGVRVDTCTYKDPRMPCFRSSDSLIHIQSDAVGEWVLWRGSNRISYKLHLREWSHTGPGEGTKILKIAWVPERRPDAWTYVWRRLTPSEDIGPRVCDRKDRVWRAGLLACERNGSMDLYQQEIARLHAVMEDQIQ